ncbi:unnamed protein product [Prunus armeniaca]|uniref:Uncharacterized protein n=1 Tax=Prunus armeniaca TaxID=36596 RepID=A0A6J5XLQ6_PRUAR|nr:unnamed protein product [Prunus armeniaca]
MSQDDVARHGGADGDTKLACRKAMWLAWVAWVFGEACGPFTRPLPFGKEVGLFWNFAWLRLRMKLSACCVALAITFFHIARLGIKCCRSKGGYSLLEHTLDFGDLDMVSCCHCFGSIGQVSRWSEDLRVLGTESAALPLPNGKGPWSVSKSEGREAQRQLHVGFVVSLLQCLTAKTSESFREKIFHGSYRSARLKVVGAFGIGKSRLRQQKVSARVVMALARGLLRFSKVKKWRFQPSVASVV